jgi:hypothetical protein
MLFPTIGRVYVSRTPKEAYNQNASFQQWWFGQQYHGILLVPLSPFMPELLQGSTWTGSVIRCIPWSRCYFWTTMNFFKMTMPTSTHVELFILGLKSIKVNSNIFPDQPSHQIWTSLNHSGQFWRWEWGTDSHLQHL